MKIAHTEASCGWGGQEIRILEESAGMIRRGHEVVILCPPEARILQEGVRRGVPIHPLPIGRKRLGGFLALRDWLVKHPVNVVNSHSSTDTWLAALACKSLKTPPPIVRTRHISAPIPRSATSRWLYGDAVAHVVTTGKTLREQVIRETGVAPERVSSIATGIDLQRYCPGDSGVARYQLGLPSTGKFLVGIVATLRSWKGHEHLLRAIAGMARQDIELVVVGDGPRRDFLHKLSNDLGLDLQVRFVGQQDDVVRWFQSFDLAVLPSYANEGVPQSLMQAMACGVPVISTPVGAIPEIVQDGITGRLVAPADPQSLALAIGELLGDQKLRHRLAIAGRKLIKCEFGIESMLDRMEAVFRTSSKLGIGTGVLRD